MNKKLKKRNGTASGFCLTPFAQFDKMDCGLVPARFRTGFLVLIVVLGCFVPVPRCDATIDDSGQKVLGSPELLDRTAMDLLVGVQENSTSRTGQVKKGRESASEEALTQKWLADIEKNGSQNIEEPLEWVDFEGSPSDIASDSSEDTLLDDDLLPDSKDSGQNQEPVQAN